MGSNFMNDLLTLDMGKLKAEHISSCIHLYSIKKLCADAISTPQLCSLATFP